MPDSTTNDQQRNEAVAPSTEQVVETQRRLTSVPLDNGSVDPDEVRIALSQAIEQATASAGQITPRGNPWRPWRLQF